MNYYKIKNTRALEIKFLGPTNYRGARIKITDNYNKDKKESITLSYCYRIGNVLEQATNVLIEAGFNIISRSSMPEKYILSVDNWGENFISIKKIKN